MKPDFFDRMARGWMKRTGFYHRPLESLIIEPTNACTASCPVCGAHADGPPIPQGMMRRDLFEELARQAVVLRPGQVSLYGHGEPLLHPDLNEMIQHLASLGLKTNVVSNGDLLTAERVQSLAAAGLGCLEISDPSVSAENYRACRGTPFAADRQHRLCEAIRGLKGGRTEVAVKCFILPPFSQFDALARLLQTWFCEGEVESVLVHGYLPWPNHVREDYLHTLLGRNMPCTLSYNVLRVGWDGTLTPCPFDVDSQLSIGRFPEVSLAESVNGAAWRRLRRQCFGKQKPRPSLCQRCLLPRTHSPLLRVVREPFCSLTEREQSAFVKKGFLESLALPVNGGLNHE